MKNRNLVCYALDILSMAALIGAALALLSALFLAGASVESILMASFRGALMLAVAGFLAARTYEIGLLLKAEPVPERTAEAFSDDNIEALPSHERLPRAA